jgi:pimeloyl-ACP methyl ester carboxylesterase
MKIVLAALFISLFCNDSLYCQTNCDTLTFVSYGSRVRGYYYYSHIRKSPTLIFTQGFMDTGDIWNVGKILSGNRINVFMFDFRGCFNSEGKQSLMNSQEDIGSAILFLKSKGMVDKYGIDTTNIIIGGYSYGGHMSMLYAVKHPENKRVISISGGDLGILGDIVNSSSEIRKQYSDIFKSIKKPAGPVDFAYDNPLEELLQNHEFFYILHQTEKLSDVDILMTGGLDDSVVDMEHYILPLYRKLKKNKSLKIKCLIFQTGHSYKKASITLVEDIANWINKLKH